MWADVDVRLAVLITGGKDSALALHRVLRDGHKVGYLVTMIPEREDSWMFHFPNIRLTGLFAEACGIPLVKAETSGVKGEELEDLKRLLAKLDVEGVVSGAISSEYQKNRIDRICGELGVRSMTPLWHEDPAKLMMELINRRFEVIIVGVYAYGFDESWLGREINQSTLDALGELNRKYQISLVGEGGEYETLVLCAPYFNKRIRIVQSEVVWQRGCGYFSVTKAELIRDL